MKILAVLFYFFLVCIPSIAQDNMDSLWSVWNDHEQADTARCKAMQRITRDGYVNTQPDSAFYFAQLVYDLAKRKNLRKYMASALSIQSNSFLLQNNYYQAS